jgi:hypothetical protein
MLRVCAAAHPRQLRCHRRRRRQLYCGDCWDAALVASKSSRNAMLSQAPTCAHAAPTCHLRAEQWFAVEHTPMQKAFCKACCLSFWGFSAADMVVSAVEDSSG